MTRKKRCGFSQKPDEKNRGVDKVTVDYKRDLYHNYMVLPREEGADSYGWQMILFQDIPGFLKLEERRVDNQRQIYYDITSRQPLQWLLQKGKLEAELIIRLFTGLLDALEQAKEYLLSEDDFILAPEYIYWSLSETKAFFCYYPGYGKTVRDQLHRLMELVMDKVDYEDQEAVMIIHGLYQIGRREECTVTELRKILNKKKEPFGDLGLRKKGPDKEDLAEGILGDSKVTEDFAVQIDSLTAAEKGKKGNLPFEPQGLTSFKEERQAEREVRVYKKTMLLASAGSVTACLGCMAAAARLGWLREPVTGVLQPVRMGLFLLIIGGLETLLLRFFLDEDKKMIKVVAEKEVVEAVHSREWYENNRKEPMFSLENQSENENKGFVEFEDTTLYNLNGREEDAHEIEHERDQERVLEEGETVLLGQAAHSSYALFPKTALYDMIELVEFPFFIGKLKPRVDYAIDKEVISRFHAKFSAEDGSYWLTDLNSTNGTYLNGYRLNPNEKVLLQEEDEIAFADIVYYFRKV